MLILTHCTHCQGPLSHRGDCPACEHGTPVCDCDACYQHLNGLKELWLRSLEVGDTVQVHLTRFGFQSATGEASCESLQTGIVLEINRDENIGLRVGHIEENGNADYWWYSWDDGSGGHYGTLIMPTEWSPDA